MKNLISSIAILGIAANLLVSDQSIAKSSKIEEFTVVGNEPFWNITVTKEGIVFKLIGEKQQIFPYTAPLPAQGRPIDKVRVYQLQGKGRNILILNKVNDCSDTMSDNKYSYSAIFIMGNQVLEGCAVKK
ncbi:COG3650 family protein [Anabaena sp. PCC 7108]|uniref:COG3650 family protein n=1 Tax=Anabaena sp. PCC 7108 TaxID=163908 RepID=UPI000345E2F8|nr:hypothetical protein [Anabaena sp. PCC 7108]